MVSLSLIYLSLGARHYYSETSEYYSLVKGSSRIYSRCQHQIRLIYTALSAAWSFLVALISADMINQTRLTQTHRRADFFSFFLSFFFARGKASAKQRLRRRYLTSWLWLFLLSVRQKILGKKTAINDVQFAKNSLPKITLEKKSLPNIFFSGLCWSNKDYFLVSKGPSWKSFLSG